MKSSLPCLLLLLFCAVPSFASPTTTVQVETGGTISQETPPPPTPELETSIIHTTIDPNPTVDFRSDLPLFVPTHEWQEVMPGQHVPGGLHYRLDLELGKKWAKHLPGIDGEMAAERQAEQDAMDKLKQIRIVDNVGSSDNDNNNDPHTKEQRKHRRTQEQEKNKGKNNGKGLKYKKLTPDQVELQRAELMDRVLRGLPAPPPELIGLDKKIDPEKWKEVLNLLWIKRQKMIHGASAQIHNSATAMQNATRDLLDVTTTEAEKIQILTAMEREVRQIDNAQDFKTVGGLAVTASLLEDPSLHVQKLSAFVMATASRNHPVVQAAALELGVVDQLVKHLQRMFSTEVDSEDFELRLSTTSKLLHALGAVVRGAEDSVKHLGSIGGPSVIESLLQLCQQTVLGGQNNDGGGTALPPKSVNPVKRQRQLCSLRDKIFTLTTDLLVSPYSWEMSPTSFEVYVAAIDALSVCASGPNREVSLKLLVAMLDDWQSSSSDSIKNQKTSSGSIKKTLEVWIKEWTKEVQEDPEDEYAKELIALGIEVDERL